MARRAPRNMEQFKTKSHTKDNKKADNDLNSAKSLEKKIREYKFISFFNSFQVVLMALGLFSLAYLASANGWCNLKFALEIAGAPFIISLAVFEFDSISKDSRDFYESISKQNENNS